MKWSFKLPSVSLISINDDEETTPPIMVQQQQDNNNNNNNNSSSEQQQVIAPSIVNDNDVSSNYGFDLLYC